MAIEATHTTDEEIAQAEPAKILEFKPKNGKPAEAAPPPSEKSSRLTEADMIPGGRAEKSITLNQENKLELINQFINYQNTLREMQQKEIALTPQQKIYLETNALDQLQQGTINKDGMNILLSAIYDEQLQKSRYLGVRAKNSPATTETQMTGRFRRKTTITDVSPTTGLVDTETTDRVTSPYIEHSGFKALSRGEQENDYASLNELRLQVESSLFEGGFKNPLFESDDATGFPVTGENANGSLLQIKQHQKREEILKERGLEGRSMSELFSEKPVQAYEIAEEAINRALLEVAKDEGKRLLSEPPRVSGTVLEAQAKKLEEKPKHEDQSKAVLELGEAHQKAEAGLIESQEAAITTLKETQESAEAALKETQESAEAALKETQEATEVTLTSSQLAAETILTRAQEAEALSKTKLDDAQKELDEAKQSFEVAKGQYTQGLNLLNESIRGMSDRIGGLQDELTNLPAITKDNENIITASRQKLNAEIDSLESKIVTTRGTVLQRLDHQIAAEQKQVIALAKLEPVAEEWEVAVENREDAQAELLARRATLSTAQAAHKTALRTLQETNRTDLKNLEDANKIALKALEETNKADLKTLQETNKATLKTKTEKSVEIKDAPPEKKEQAAAIRTWGKLLEGDNYRRIFETRYSQTPEGAYTKQKLGDTTENNGQLEGAEAIRAHIVKLIDPVNYNPEQARKMISDETIARALLYQLRIDPETTSSVPDPTFIGPGAPDGSYRSVLQGIQTEKAALAELDPKKRANAAEIKTRQERVRTLEKGLLKDLLPTLKNRSEFEVGSVIRFLAREGLLAAEQNGNPYLDLSDETKYTIKDFQEAEVSQTAESIVREDLGTATLTKDTATYVGKTHPEWGESRQFGTPLDITMRIEQKSGRDRTDNAHIDYQIAVRVDQRLLEALPETVDPLNPSIPIELRKIFYDVNGTFRQDLGPIERFAQAFNRGPNQFSALKGIPEWIVINNDIIRDDPLTPGSTGENRAAAKFTERLPAIINPVPGEEDIAARNHMETAFGKLAIDMGDQERRDALRGVSARIPVRDIPLTGTAATKNYEIDIDHDGKVMIGEAGGTPRKELRQHLKDRMLEIQALRGTTSLDQADRDAFWFEETQILQILGREVLIGQQRKQ